jgi:hypothetical protein
MMTYLEFLLEQIYSIISKETAQSSARPKNRTLIFTHRNINFSRESLKTFAMSLFILNDENKFLDNQAALPPCDQVIDLVFDGFVASHPAAPSAPQKDISAVLSAKGITSSHRGIGARKRKSAPSTETVHH